MVYKQISESPNVTAGNLWDCLQRSLKLPNGDAWVFNAANSSLSVFNGLEQLGDRLKSFGRIMAASPMDHISIILRHFILTHCSWMLSG